MTETTMSSASALDVLAETAENTQIDEQMVWDKCENDIKAFCERHRKNFDETKISNLIGRMEHSLPENTERINYYEAPYNSISAFSERHQKALADQSYERMPCPMPDKAYEKEDQTRTRRKGLGGIQSYKYKKGVFLETPRTAEQKLAESYIARHGPITISHKTDLTSFLRKKK